MNKTILVVDDNEADHFMCEHAIQSFDSTIEITRAYDGKEALDKLNTLEQAPDLILLDINMPGMNGFDFLEAAYQQQYKDANIIVMLTTAIRDDEYERCLAYPMVLRTTAKPITMQFISDYFVSQSV